MMKPVIRPTTAADATGITRIYNHYVLTTFITFETEAVAVSEMVERIGEIQATPLPWLVAEANGRLVGYAYASKWKGRCAYRHSVECTAYVDHEALGNGAGVALYAALLAALRSQSMHAVIGGIALPNARSVALHERFGFRKVAHFEQVGFKFDQWIDVGYWELLL
jgi:phosphinothricin acetyltransferase